MNVFFFVVIFALFINVIIEDFFFKVLLIGYNVAIDEIILSLIMCNFY